MRTADDYHSGVLFPILFQDAVAGLVAIILLLTTAPVHAFGPTGHRVVGRIAENHLTSRATQAVRAILENEALAQASTWPDEIRSDPRWDHSRTWHYVTIEDGETYESSTKNQDGDVIEAIGRFVAFLKDPETNNEDKVIAIRWLVHLVGDVHQPLHVGRGADRGGNTIDAQWFGEKTNIHVVWDSGLIESTKLSYSELAEFIDTVPASQVQAWQQSTVLDWARESIGYRNRAYKVPEPTFSGSYRYAYTNVPLVNQRLVQAGVRLAGLLNSIFSDVPANPTENPPIETVPAEEASFLATTGTVPSGQSSEKEKQSLAVLGGILWVQSGEEYRAISISAYHQARHMLDLALADKAWTALPEKEAHNPLEQKELGALPPAVILDVDETVLDNSPYQAWLTKQKATYSSITWNRWVMAASANAIPGAVEFIDYARRRGVTVFYVSNRVYRGDVDVNGNNNIEPDERNKVLKPYTIKNLRAIGLLPQEPVSDDASVLLRGEMPGWQSDKTSRRRMLAEKYRILLLMGDSLGDFIGYDFGNHHGSYYDLDETTRRQELRKHRHRWAKSWIALPNPTYGSWLPRQHQQRLDALDAWNGRVSTLPEKRP